ncbi:MAG TPA: cell surface protein SprA, partial [Chitinophagaceae bacterium]|nr:cell surface protein SprA [Chitinophagaceae bacterium]
MARKIHFSALVVTGIASFFFANSPDGWGRGHRSFHPAFVPVSLPQFPLKSLPAQPTRRDLILSPTQFPVSVRVLPDTTIGDSSSRDSLIFPLQDQGEGFGTDSNYHSLDLQDPPNIRRSVEYQQDSGRYDIRQQVGTAPYRYPQYLSLGQYLQLQSSRDEEDYFQQRAATMDLLNRKTAGPLLYHGPLLYNRIFGGTQSDIRPQGNLDLTFGYQGQNYANPTLPEAARHTGGFNFNMNVNMNVVGKIGTKLKITTAYNTQSTFDFQKQVKLEYTGDDNEIIRKIEAGNVSFPLHSSLITGVQSLFG